MQSSDHYIRLLGSKLSSSPLLQATTSNRPLPRAKALLWGSHLLQLLRLSSRNPSHPHRLRRILAPSSAVEAPRAGAGHEGIGPNPLVPTRLSTHGSFCSFLASLLTHRWAACILCVAVATRQRQHLCPSDSQRWHSVRILGETPSCGVPDTRQPECKKGGGVMPPCLGDGQQGDPRTGPTTVSRLLQQPLLGAKKVEGPEAGYKPKACKSLYKEGEVQDGDYQVYPESVISSRLGDIHRPEGCVHVLPHSSTSQIPEEPQDNGRGQRFSSSRICLSGCHQPQQSFVGSQESWAPYCTNSASIFICTWTICSSKPRHEPSVWHTPI